MADIYDQLLDEQTPQNSTTEAMPVAANEPDIYDKLLDEVQKSQRAAVDASIQQAVKIAPQQAATVQQLAKSTGLPVELVERNLDAVQTQEKIKQVQSLLSASPFLQRQMADPNFAKLAQNDLQSLGLFERTYRGLGGGATEAVGRTIGGVGELIDIAQRNLTQAFANTFLPDAADGSRPDPNSLVGPRIAEGWEQTGDIVKDAARDIMVPALQQTFYDQVAAGLGQVGAQILAAVLTGGVTNVTSLYAQGADVMADMVENDPASQGMKDLAVLGGAALTGITEKWALDRILGPLAVPIQNQLGAALARIGIAGLSEGGQEALESIGQDALRQYLTNPEAKIRLGEALDEGAVGATVGVIVRTVVESAAGVHARHVRLKNQAAQAEQNAATLEQLNQIAAADELLKISPETFEQFVAAAAEDGPVQAVYIDAQTLMQSGVADQLAQLSPSVQEQLAVAAATNGTVQIPIAEYATKIAPTEYAQSLLDHLKTDPQGFSRAEARDYLQTQQQQLEQDVEQALQMKADDVVFMESQQKVKDLVLNELNTLGRFTPQKNELDATLIAARSAVRAAQLGMTPEAFFESQRLRFAAERIDGAETFNQFDAPVLKPTEAETGKPVTLYFARNPVSAKGMAPAGMDFGQDIEPAGEYMVVQESDMSTNETDGWQYGTVTFRNPLVLEHKSTSSTGWKKDLSDMFGGKTGKALANAVKKAGYDGIITRDKDGYSETVNLSGQKGSAQQYNQSAYHGTPHRFDKFSLDAIGTGEGAQVYGWGLYFAGSKEVAQWYRDTLTEARAEVIINNRLEVNGEVIPESSADYQLLQTIADGGGFDAYIADREQSLTTVPQESPVYRARSRGIEKAKALKEKYDNARVEYVRDIQKKRQDGTLYQVDIPEDSDLLNYDERYNDQPEKVRQNLAVLFNRLDRADFLASNPTGVDIYNALAGFATDGQQFRTTETFVNREEALAFYKEKLAAWRGQEGTKIQPAVVQDFDDNWQITYGQELEEIYGVEANISADRSASLVLNKVGIPGLRYQDGMSRGTSDGSFNYVIWDDAAVTVEAVNDELAQARAQEQGEYFQSETLRSNPIVDPERNLYVAHNIRPEGILAANELGALAAPSIAVARADIGFENFGDVTLIAEPSLLTSSKVRTFDADIYSPRQPRPEYDIPTKKWQAFESSLDPEQLGLRKPDWQSAERDGPQALAESDAVRYKFLQEQGKLPKVKQQKVEPEFKQAAKLTGSRWQLEEDAKFQAIAKKYYDRMATQAENADARRGEKYRDMYFDEAGNVKSSPLRNFLNQVIQYRDSGGKDTRQFANDLRDKLVDGKLANDYKTWVGEQFNALVDRKQIFKGFNNRGDRKYIPYTLENVVREMTQTLQAGENYFYGAGSVRSSVANEMKTIAQVQARRDQIVSEAEFETVKAESDQKLQEALDALAPFYKFDANSWGYAEDAGKALAEGPKGQREAFRITPESQKIIDDLLNYLRGLPTVYFEAKAQRPVQFSEFNTAVVPKGMRKDALQVLKDAGLKIKTYDPKVEGERSRIIAEQTNLLFQGASRARGAYNPNTNTIALLKNADLSTFLHEAGHYFFESDINLAAEIVRGNRMLGDDSMTQGEQEILRDVSQLLDWHGLKGDINAQLDQWFNLSFEEKRAYHEKTAESFERYLFEGTAPSIELQPYFQQFRAWLLSVYKSIKDFLTRNPAAGELTDEVRVVFDRMLATTEQIQLAQQARSMMPLFRTQAEADNVGMTPEEFAAYQAQDTGASNDAIKDLEAKGLRDLQWTRNARNREIKKLQRKAAELRREARIEARADVLSEPVYRAWQFLTAKMQDTDRITPFTPRKSDPNTVDPTVDSLFTAMAKLGGINKQAVVETWGVEDSERPNSGVFGKPVLRRQGGRTIDEMAELLAEQGYVQTDADGKAIVEDFELKFDSELRGEPRYSVQYDYSQDDAARLRPGEQVNILALGAGRLDLDSLGEYDLTDDQLKLLKSYRMTAASGLHPDLVAELPGIEMSSGDELVRRLLDATPLGEEIEARTDAIMLERYGELATPEAIEREADRAIHNEARARMVATEANALAKATGQRKVLGPVARQFAQAMVARSKVRDVKPSTYASAEARAAKAAEKASRAGDLTLAAAEKRNQLVNTYAAKAAYDALEEVDSGLRYLRKFEREGSRKGLDVEYLDQIDTLLERFDLRKGQSLRAIDKRTTLAQWVAAQEQAGLEPNIPDYIMAEANRTSYKNLTVEEFRGMVDSVKQIEHLGRLKKKLLTAKDQRELDAIVGDITARIEQAAGGRVVDNEVRDTVGSKLAYFGRWIGAAHRKAASVARELDGLVDGGPMWEYFTRTMNEAGDREATMRADASKRLHELAKPILTGESMGGKGRFFPSLNRSLNRGERLAIALNWGNESNRQRLLGGKGWTAAQMQPVLNSLTSTEWTFVQGVWDFFESYRPEIAAKERRVYGKEPDWIEPSAFEITTADGQRIQVRGGYYPIKYDPKQSGKAGEFAEAEDAKAMMRAAYTAATTRRSFTKGRVEEVQGRPLLLTFDGIWQGANEVIHDLTWHEWLIDANRLLRRLDGPIRTGFGAEYMEILRKAVKDAARGDQPAANLVEKSLTHIRNGSTIVGMGWNITTALMQPLGYTNSVVRIGGKWMARGLSEFFGSPRHMIEKAEEVQAMSEMMRTRMMTMNREINDVRNRLTSDRSELRERIEGSYFIMIQKLQAMVDYPTWLGAYAKAIDDPANINPDGTINEARAAALADQAVLDAQGGGQIKDLAEVQRGNPLLKLFTNFYSYFNVLYNLTTEQTKKRVKAKEYAGLMGDYLLLMVVPAVLSAIIRNAVKGEDDEDEYVKAIASELVGYPFGMFVGLREVAGAAQLAAGVGNPAFGYAGPAGLRFFSEMNKLGVQVGQGELDMALFKAANNVGGLLFHYPASQVNRAVEGSAALIDGDTQNPLAPFVGVNRN